uniref:FAD-dependent oxidoreductase n=1 Tax=Sphingomonas bacterium TaxID=1895847 RepID=UPI001C2D4452
LGLQACAPGVGPIASAGMAPRFARPPLVPMRLTPDQIVDLKCCIRPLRAAGPRLDTEQIGDTLVVHNYGHGGSGWSLSWGSGEVAVGKAMSVLPKEIAVIGCGIVGLTAAVMAQRAGLKVTIYAREMIQRTRSFRASGSYTPDSRVALAAPAGPGFGDLWEQMARFSWKSFRTMIGIPGDPVVFHDSYTLSDTPMHRHEFPADPAITDSYANTGRPHQNSEYGHYSDRIKDIVPQMQPLAAEENPFPVGYAARTSQMHFNFASYAHILLTEFLERGGRFEQRDFHAPGEVTSLKEKVVIHSTGYAARDLWRDKTIIPVRGQTGWLAPQPEAAYSIRYKNGLAMSKADGVVIMNFDNDLGEMQGVGNSYEVPDRADTEAALASLAPLFSTPKARA